MMVKHIKQRFRRTKDELNRKLTIEQAKLERAKATTLTNSSPKKDCYFPEEKTEVDRFQNDTHTENNTSTDEVVQKKKKTFRISSRKLWLTWPQLTLKPKEVLAQLEEILYTWGIKQHLIVQEEHEDGSPHIHAYLEMYKKVEIKNPKKLHIKNEGKMVFGNYQAAKKSEYILRYATKKFNPDELGEKYVASKHIAQRLDHKCGIISVDESIIHLAKTGFVQDALDMFEFSYPKSFMRTHMSLEKSLRSLRMKALGFKSKFSMDDFCNVPATFIEYCDQQNFNKSLILIGAPGLAKSALVRAYFEKYNPFECTHIDGLKNFDSEQNKAIIFDDISGIEKFTREMKISLVESETISDINIKHGSVRIPAETAKIFTTNKTLKEMFEPDGVDKAVQRRCQIIEVQQSMKKIMPGDETLMAPEQLESDKNTTPGGGHQYHQKLVPTSGWRYVHHTRQIYK